MWPEAVLSSATRTIPSSPGLTLRRKSKGHSMGRMSGEWVPGRMVAVSFVHFVRCCNVWRYSMCHLFQNHWCSVCTSCHLFRHEGDVSSIVGSGKATRGAPIKKLPGVRVAVSKGPFENGGRGLEFSTALIWLVRVKNSSKVRMVSPLTHLSCCFTYSERLPIWGAAGGLKWNCTPLGVANPDTKEWCL